MLKRILFIAIGILLLGAVGLGVMRFLVSRRAPAPPVGTLTPDEQDEVPLISGDGQGNVPLFSGSASPAGTTGGTSSGTVGLSAHAVCAAKWQGETDDDKDELPNNVETRYGTDPKKADTDGDGFPDGTEVKNGYDPKTAGNARLDSDQDGLLEHDECQWKSDPFRADSDGDGFRDGDEVQNGYDPTKKGDGKGSDALPLKQAQLAEQALRPDPNSANQTESLTAQVLGNQNLSNANNVQVTQQQVEQFIASAKLNTTLPEVKVTELSIKNTNTVADVRAYLQAVDAISTRDLADPAVISNAVSSALNGQTKPMSDLRLRIAQYERALRAIPTPPSAVEHHVLYISLIRFLDDRLGTIERVAAADPVRFAIVAKELQESFGTNLPRLRTLRTALDKLAAG